MSPRSGKSVLDSFHPAVRAWFERRFLAPTATQRSRGEPLAEIAAVAREIGYSGGEIRTMLRTGDTTSADRQLIVKRPPHILITTPESLYLMLTAERSREVLRPVKTLIVD